MVLYFDDLCLVLECFCSLKYSMGSCCSGITNRSPSGDSGVDLILYSDVSYYHDDNLVMGYIRRWEHEYELASLKNLIPVGLGYYHWRCGLLQLELTPKHSKQSSNWNAFRVNRCTKVAADESAGFLWGVNMDCIQKGIHCWRVYISWINCYNHSTGWFIGVENGSRAWGLKLAFGSETREGMGMLLGAEWTEQTWRDSVQDNHLKCPDGLLTDENVGLHPDGLVAENVYDMLLDMNAGTLTFGRITEDEITKNDTHVLKDVDPENRGFVPTFRTGVSRCSYALQVVQMHPDLFMKDKDMTDRIIDRRTWHEHMQTML